MRPDGNQNMLSRVGVLDTGQMGISVDPPAHAAHPARGGLRLAGVVAGVAAITAAIAVAVPTLRGDPAPAASSLTTARSLTVTVPRAVIPLSGDELGALLRQPPDLGPLQAPSRLASCLSGLGYPTDTTVLGARPVEINGRPAVVLVLPDDAPGLLAALAVAPHCSGAHTGLVADTTVTRP